MFFSSSFNVDNNLDYISDLVDDATNRNDHRIK